MRVSKWHAIVRASFARDLCVAVPMTLAWLLLGLPPEYLMVPAILSLLLLTVIQIPGNWPRRMTAEKWDEVLRGPVVHFTTPERAMEMARGGSSMEGGMPGWVHVILPAENGGASVGYAAFGRPLG